jgi:hypothetical protein
MADDHIAKVITGMGPVSIDEHEQLKARVYGLADKVGEMALEQAKIAGRVESAEESIDRLRLSSATSGDVKNVETVVTLKLDHLLEKQVDMKNQIAAMGWKLVVFSLAGGAVATAIALWFGFITFTPAP